MRCAQKNSQKCHTWYYALYFSLKSDGCLYVWVGVILKPHNIRDFATHIECVAMPPRSEKRARQGGRSLADFVASRQQFTDPYQMHGLLDILASDAERRAILFNVRFEGFTVYFCMFKAAFSGYGA